MENEKNKIIKAGMGYIVGNYFLKGLTFFTIPIFSRLLSVSEYGIYSIYVSYESILVLFMGLGVSYSFKNAKYKYGKQFDKYVSSLIFLICLNAVILCAALRLLFPLYSSRLGLDKGIIYILLFHSLCNVFLTFYNSYIGLEYKFKSYILIALINAVINTVVSVGMILILPSGYKYFGRIAGTIFPLIFIGIYILAVFMRTEKPCYEKEYWKYALDYGLPMIPHGLSIVILTQFDRIMIHNMTGAKEAGIYSFAYNIYMIISVTASSLDNVWGPWFFSKMESKHYEEIRRGISVYTICMAVFSGVVILISPELIWVLGGSDYNDAIYCVMPIVAGGFFAYLYTIPVQIEYYKEKTKYIALASGTAAILNVILNMIFISKFGYIAASYTTLFTYFLYFLFHWRIGTRLLGIAEKNAISSASLMIVSFMVLFFCFLGLIFKERFLIRWCIGAAIFGVTCYKFKLTRFIKYRFFSAGS